MAKTKTSVKPKAFSMDELPIRKLKNPSRAKAHDPDKKLRDVEFISKALMDCLWSGDMAAFKEIVKAHYEAVNTAKALRGIGLSKRTFYEAVSPKGNPRLDTVAKIIQGLKRIAW